MKKILSNNESKISNTSVNAEITSSEAIMVDFRSTEELCAMLLQSPHYKRLGADGIYAIVQKAKSVGISPLTALNGGMYYVQGRVELAAETMNQLIRMAGHSITKDKKSDDTVCILHGKRKDTGDTWSESFSIEDAKKAGIYRNQWIKYPKDMVFARALSRLARQLYPDVIKGCYVEGEISQAIESDRQDVEQEEASSMEIISDEQFEELEGYLHDSEDLKTKMISFLKTKWGIESLKQMPTQVYDFALSRAKEEWERITDLGTNEAILEG